MKKQALWSSKGIFILAAIGSAAGLGNLWKFPYLVYDNGGLAFIIAYLFMLFFVGLGLLVGEVALGQKYRKGFVGALGKISPFFRWLGWMTVGLSFAILSYYVVVIGWGMDYLFYSIKGLFSQSLAWSGDSSAFFYSNVLGLTDGVGEKGVLSMPIFYGVLFSIILLYFFTFKSAKSVGKVVLITASLPFATLFLLALKSLSLDNSGEGLSLLTTLDLDKLYSLSTWTAAGGQIFFTLSVAMGVMVAYGALKKEKSELVKATILVALGNTLISFLSAIVVFGTLGYLASIKGVSVSEVASGGPGLVFSVIPETLSHFGSFSAILSVVFFLTVFLLAIDSAMSLVEAVTIPLKNKFKSIGVEKITLFVIVALALTSSIYMYGNGLYILDIVDHYITQFAMLLIGFFELIVFLLIAKKLGKYIDERNKCFLKKIINRRFFVFSWILGVILVGFLLLTNIKSGILIYDSYNSRDLIFYGIYPILIIFLLSVFMNIMDIVRKK